MMSLSYYDVIYLLTVLKEKNNTSLQLDKTAEVDASRFKREQQHLSIAQLGHLSSSRFKREEQHLSIAQLSHIPSDRFKREQQHFFTA